jgi:hypothetical protein
MITPINSPHPVDVHQAAHPPSEPKPDPRLHPSTKAAKSRKTRSRSKAPANPTPTADSVGSLSDVAGATLPRANRKGAPS